MTEEDLDQNLLQQALDLWINPEIERRREAGHLPDEFVLSRAQIVTNVDADVPEVRFNEEIKAIAHFRAARAIDEGELITESDVSDIVDIELTDQDPNAGHLTMISFKGRWFLAFDFRYNAARVASIIDAAREFLDLAAYTLEQNHTRAFVDNLFSTTELLAKGQLLMYPDESLLKSKTHTVVKSKFNQEGYLGNADSRFVKLLNRLHDLRGSARYLDKDFSLSGEEARDMLGTAEDMFESVQAAVPPRHRTRYSS